MTKNKSKKSAKRGNIYETVSNNIQKITRPSGTTSYRVRVTEDGILIPGNPDNKFPKFGG